MASFGAHHRHFLRSQSCGKCHFCTLLRYFSLMYIQYMALTLPCSATKMAISLQPELVLAGPVADKQQDDKLFAEAMGKVRRITPANKVNLEKAKPKPEAASYAQRAQPMIQSKTVISSPRQAEEEPWVLIADGISRERLRSLASGRPPVEQTLDLHGATRNEALRLLEEWFGHATGRQVRVLCIIHGRGLHSEGKAVLKEAVYQWLRGGPFAHAVLAVIPQPGSGGGACLVLLRRS